MRVPCPAARITQANGEDGFLSAIAFFCHRHYPESKKKMRVKMPLLSGLIFDLDGTLIDSAPDIRQALNAMLVEYGRRPMTLDEVKHAVGDGMMPLIQRAFEATGGAPKGFNSYATFQIFINHYRSLDPDPAQIYPQARETLEHYFDKGLKFGICTNKQGAATVQLLQKLDLVRYFSFIAGGDTFPLHKPNPGHVKGVLKELGVPAAQCAMIGDSLNDISAARGAGVKSVVVTHGYGGDYQSLGADKLIGGFRELPAALEELGFTTSS
jgi:phosphoglycolate phosphatase